MVQSRVHGPGFEVSPKLGTVGRHCIIRSTQCWQGQSQMYLSMKFARFQELILMLEWLSPITQRHPWAPRWTFLCMLSASAQKSTSRKKWHVLFTLDGFPWFKNNPVAFVLLYNMRLKRSFSFEWFQSCNIKNYKIPALLSGVSWRVCPVTNGFYCNCRANEVSI